MRLRSLLACCVLLIATALPAAATDVDGPLDCAQTKLDWGDAPEGVFAYPFVLGNFPTCAAPGAVGTQTFA